MLFKYSFIELNNSHHVQAGYFKVFDNTVSTFIEKLEFVCCYGY